MPRELPRGTVTFLFTGVDDSTRLWEESPTDMADGLRVHNAIVRDTIEGHGGYVFGIGGDGFCAAFSTAPDAAAAEAEARALALCATPESSPFVMTTSIRRAN